MLFVNPTSGGGKAARFGIPDRARRRGIEVVVLRPGDDLAALVQDAVEDGADMLGVAAGDGTLGVVAATAVAHGLPFVCIPAGTRNHFALDLGVDRRDLIGSLDAFTDGVERRIDVAEVNGRLFLNNASLGIYGDAVQQVSCRTTPTRSILGVPRRPDRRSTAGSSGSSSSTHLDPARAQGERGVRRGWR